MVSSIRDRAILSRLPSDRLLNRIVAFKDVDVLFTSQIGYSTSEALDMEPMFTFALRNMPALETYEVVVIVHVAAGTPCNHDTVFADWMPVLEKVRNKHRTLCGCKSNLTVRNVRVL